MDEHVVELVGNEAARLLYSHGYESIEDIEDGAEGGVVFSDLEGLGETTQKRIYEYLKREVDDIDLSLYEVRDRIRASAVFSTICSAKGFETAADIVDFYADGGGPLYEDVSGFGAASEIDVISTALQVDRG